MNILMDMTTKEWMKNDEYVLLVLRSGYEVVVTLRGHKIEGGALDDPFLAATTPPFEGPMYRDPVSSVPRRFLSQDVLIRVDEIVAVRKYRPPTPAAQGEW